MKHINYQPHIDGLRAIAVLSVFVYHLKESFLTGGFVGVDIFFVISGFLITKLIVTEVQTTKQFSFSRFYIRRLRRLLPSFFGTLLFCLVCAYVLFSPQHLIEFAKSLIYSIFSISNFYFWNTAGYFDSLSTFKPLLHTWSLSIEEQFYLLWPLTLVLLLKFNKTKLLIGFILAMLFVSLLLNHFFYSQESLVQSWFESERYQTIFNVNSTTFYLLPFRVFEFSLGAILIFFDPKKINQTLAALIFCIGLGMILLSLTMFNETMDFPSWPALIPCLGAAMVILSGSNHRLNKILTNKVMVGVGLISYSLYLLHWPIIVFYRYWNFGPLRASDQLIIVLAAFILSYVFYRWIEQPFRKVEKGKPNLKFIFSIVAMIIVFVVLANNAISSKGWTWRYTQGIAAQLTKTTEDYGNYFNYRKVKYDRGFVDNGLPKVAIIGDSMAGNLLNAMIEGGSSKKIDLFVVNVGANCKSLLTLDAGAYAQFFGGKAAICKAEHKKIMDKMDIIARADTVILASYWWDARKQVFIDTTAKYLKSKGVKKVMAQGMIVQNFEGVHLLSKYLSNPDSAMLRTPLNGTAVYINSILKNFATEYEYFDLIDQFCDEKDCLRIINNGYLIIFDSTHFTPEGSRYVGRNIENLPWFQHILDSAK